MTALFPNVVGSAVFSPCRRYRYTLERTWGDGPTINFLMLNPSTADAETNDPTVERCQRRAKSLGFGRLVVTNIFAWRSTDPKALLTVADPIGPENDAAILTNAKAAGLVVAAWGTHGSLLDRGAKVETMLLDAGILLHSLGVTKSGEPRHPLYVGYDMALKQHE